MRNPEAPLLFDSERFAHSASFSILAIEETAKVAIIFQIFSGWAGGVASWKGFRQHTGKGSYLNPAIVSVAKSTFPELDEETLKKVAEGPSPEWLDATKQLAWYSECFSSEHGPAWHLPKNDEWKDKATALLAEAKAITFKLRDRSPDELEVFKKHANNLKEKTPQACLIVMENIRDELVQKGLIKKEWWGPILGELQEYDSEKPL